MTEHGQNPISFVFPPARTKNSQSEDVCGIRCTWAAVKRTKKVSGEFLSRVLVEWSKFSMDGVGGPRVTLWMAVQFNDASSECQLKAECARECGETIHHHCNSGSWLDLEQSFRCGLVWSGFNCMLKSHVQCRRTWIRYSLHDPLVLSVVVFVVMGPHCSCSQNVFISIRNIMWNSFLL